MSDPLSHKPLQCAQVQALLFDLNEGEQFPTQTHDDVRAHVATCQACADYQSDLGHLTASLQQMEVVDVPDDLAARIMANIEALPALNSQQGATAEAVTLPSVTKTTAGRAPRFLRHNLTIAASFLLLAVGLTAAWQAGNFSLIDPVEQAADVPNSTQLSQGSSAPVLKQSQPNNDEAAQKAPTGEKQAPTSSRSEAKSAVLAATPNPNTFHAVPSVEKTPVHSAQIAQRPRQVVAHSTTKIASASRALAPSERAENPSDSRDQLAYVGNPGQQLNNTYGSETESDVYYDPVSTLVGF